MNKQYGYMGVINGKFKTRHVSLLDPTSGAVSGDTQTVIGSLTQVSGTAGDAAYVITGGELQV